MPLSGRQLHISEGFLRTGKSLAVNQWISSSYRIPRVVCLQKPRKYQRPSTWLPRLATWDCWSLRNTLHETSCRISSSTSRPRKLESKRCSRSFPGDHLGRVLHWCCQSLKACEFARDSHFNCRKLILAIFRTVVRRLRYSSSWPGRNKGHTEIWAHFLSLSTSCDGLVNSKNFIGEKCHNWNRQLKSALLPRASSFELRAWRNPEMCKVEETASGFLGMSLRKPQGSGRRRTLKKLIARPTNEI